MVVLGPILHPPTVQLPPIGKLISSTPNAIAESLRYLRLVYTSEVQGSRRLRKRLTDRVRSPDVSDVVIQDCLDELRMDAYERAYAIRWITAVLDRVNTAFEDLEEEIDTGLQVIPPIANLASQYDSILADASSLLAICAGTSAAGALTRTFTFPSVVGDISVTLADAPLENENFESVGAQTWGGACVLSEMIVEQPEMFGFLRKNASGAKLRVLELGAGTGLVSLALGKLLETIGIGAEIVASDFYPLVLANLQSNIRTNAPLPLPLASVTADFLDWSTFPTLDIPPAPFDVPFDIILGADIIYEPEHARWIRQCLLKLLRPPNGQSTEPPVFHLVFPLRPTHAVESQSIEDVFPMINTTIDAVDLGILQKEVIVCEAGEGRKGEVEYAYYKIGWGVA